MIWNSDLNEKREGIILKQLGFTLKATAIECFSLKSWNSMWSFQFSEELWWINAFLPTLLRVIHLSSAIVMIGVASSNLMTSCSPPHLNQIFVSSVSPFFFYLLIFYFSQWLAVIYNKFFIQKVNNLKKVSVIQHLLIRKNRLLWEFNFNIKFLICNFNCQTISSFINTKDVFPIACWIKSINVIRRYKERDITILYL